MRKREEHKNSLHGQGRKDKIFCTDQGEGIKYFVQTRENG
jgi:hypothetical protein